MGSIQRRAKDRWKARYRGPDGRERSKTFTTEREAKDWLASRTVDIRRGDWTDPKLAQVTVGDWGRRWLAHKTLRVKPSTIQSYRVLFRNLIKPYWDQVPLGGVAHSDVDAWVAHLSQRLGPSSVRKAHVVFSQILETAVRDGRLSKNPAKGVELPRITRRDNRYLSPEQVRALADAAGDEYRPLVFVLAYCGLRFGEAAALRVRSVDLLRKRIRVTQAVTEVGGLLTWGTPKNHTARSVSLPLFLREMLTEHMAGKSPDDLLFASPTGEPLRNTNFRRRVWDPAVREAGVPNVTPHDLRHTAASLAVNIGANVKAVQRMLGHASAAMTLDVYADLFEDSLDEVADRLDAAYSGSLAAPVRPGVASNVSQLPAREA